MKTGHKVALAVLLVLGVGDLLALNLVVAPNYLEERKARAAPVKATEEPPVKVARAEPDEAKPKTAEPDEVKPDEVKADEVKAEPEDVAEPEVKAEPESKPESKPEVKAAPESKPEVKAAPESKPEVKAEPEPKPKPEPVKKPPPPPPLPRLSDLRFTTGSSTLSVQARRMLDRAAAALKARPRQRIFVHGHADERGAEATNVRLSNLRAATVTRYLVSRGVARGRITQRSHGASRPLDRSNTAEAWGKNRRVEIKWK